MIIDFAVKNFLSFKDEVSFSMLAAKSVKEMEDSDNGCSNVSVIGQNNLRLLRTAAIYGANGSGKSNLIQAFSFFQNFVIDSFHNDGFLKDFNRNQFLFSSEKDDASAFEMTFIKDDTKYRYGFSILGETIDKEWLFKQQADAVKESYCFKRMDGEIVCNAKIFKVTKEAKASTRNNALFLSVAALFNTETAIRIKNFFTADMNIISGIKDNTVSVTAHKLNESEDMHKRIVAFMKYADFGIEDIRVEETLAERVSDIKDPILRKLLGSGDYDQRPSEKKLRNVDIKSFHSEYDGETVSGLVSLDFGYESVGTIKTFAMIGPWLDTLMNGKVLIVDEFGASLHTKLALELLRLFQSRLNNGSQLIVTTHDTNLLRKDLFRRDQIWFVEKDKYGVSDLYSLVEYKINQATSVRNDASFSKDYLAGKYGAIPHFGNIQQFIEDYGR